MKRNIAYIIFNVDKLCLLIYGRQQQIRLLYDFLENSPFGLPQDQNTEDENLENILAVQ